MTNGACRLWQIDIFVKQNLLNISWIEIWTCDPTTWGKGQFTEHCATRVAFYRNYTVSKPIHKSSKNISFFTSYSPINYIGLQPSNLALANDS